MFPRKYSTLEIQKLEEFDIRVTDILNVSVATGTDCKKPIENLYHQFSMIDQHVLHDKLQHHLVKLFQLTSQYSDSNSWQEAAFAAKSARSLHKWIFPYEKSTYFRLKVSEFIALTHIKDNPDKYTQKMWFKFSSAAETFCDIDPIRVEDLKLLVGLIRAMRDIYPKMTIEYATYDRALNILTEKDYDPGYLPLQVPVLQGHLDHELPQFLAGFMYILEKIHYANLLINRVMKERISYFSHQTINQYADALQEKAGELMFLTFSKSKAINNLDSQIQEIDKQFFGVKRGLFLLFDRDKDGKVKKAKFIEKTHEDKQKDRQLAF